MSYMLSEIHQQPEIISKLVENERDSVAELAAEINRRDIKFVIMVARGTSDHAAIYGKYLLEVNNALPVALADASVFTLYEAKLKLENTLVIGVSQSGEATDVIEYLSHSKEYGALTAAITNEPESSITKIADHTMLCYAGKELAVAATKTYTATLAAFYLLSASLAHEKHCESLLSCAETMKSVLSVEKHIAEITQRYRYMETGAVLGRGFNYSTALEMALKLKETSYIGMIGHSAADFQHGPIAMVHEGYPCFLIAPPGKTYSAMLEITKRLNDQHAETIVISGNDEILSEATIPIKIEADIDEELSPLVYIIPGQIMAYYSAISRGYDPDRPRGLSKVTLTR